jgi:hypothetical protein
MRQMFPFASPRTAEEALFLEFPRYYTPDGELFSGRYAPDGWPIPHVSQWSRWPEVVRSKRRQMIRDRVIASVAVALIAVLMFAFVFYPPSVP